MGVRGSSFLAEGLVEGPAPGKGSGTFAHRPFAKGEVLAVFGGDVVDYARLLARPFEDRSNCVQVSESLYLVPNPVGPGDRMNHSCDPNAGMQGQIALVALRDIAPGEEICFDYAMTDSSDYDEFECACRSPRCRGRITGRDWTLPELRERYRGYFSTYLAGRIDSEAPRPRPSEPGPSKLRGAASMFCIQVVAYLLATLNFRVVQSGSYSGVAVTDALLATFGFLVVRRVARSEEAWHLWLGYMLGGVAGGVLGLAVSLWLGT